MGYFPQPGFDVAVWDEVAEAYPPRPNALVVRYIGPVEPTDWTALDEWRAYGTAPVTPVDPDSVATLAEWLKADAITGLANADPVATWTASAGNNATQETSSAQPTYRTGIVNGLPVVRFDGDDFLSFAGLGATLSEFTILTILRPTGTGQMSVVNQDIANFSNDLLTGINPDTAGTTAGLWATSMHKNAGSVRAVATDPTPPDTTNFQLVGVRYNGANIEQLRDGATPVATTAASAFTLTDRTWAVGRNAGAGDRYFGGDIAEIVIYSTAIDDVDLANVIAGLQQKYGLV